MSDASDEPREYPAEQSWEQDYLDIDGHTYASRPLAKVLAAILAVVAQLQSGKHWKELPSDTPYDLAILGAAEDVVEAIRLCKEDA